MPDEELQRLGRQDAREARVRRLRERVRRGDLEGDLLEYVAEFGDEDALAACSGLVEVPSDVDAWVALLEELDVYGLVRALTAASRRAAGVVGPVEHPDLEAALCLLDAWCVEESAQAVRIHGLLTMNAHEGGYINTPAFYVFQSLTAACLLTRDPECVVWCEFLPRLIAGTSLDLVRAAVVDEVGPWLLGEGDPAAVRHAAAAAGLAAATAAWEREPSLRSEVRLLDTRRRQGLLDRFDLEAAATLGHAGSLRVLDRASIPSARDWAHDLDRPLGLHVALAVFGRVCGGLAGADEVLADLVQHLQQREAGVAPGEGAPNLTDVRLAAKLDAWLSAGGGARGTPLMRALAREATRWLRPWGEPVPIPMPSFEDREAAAAYVASRALRLLERQERVEPLLPADGVDPLSRWDQARAAVVNSIRLGLWAEAARAGRVLASEVADPAELGWDPRLDTVLDALRDAVVAEVAPSLLGG